MQDPNRKEDNMAQTEFTRVAFRSGTDLAQHSISLNLKHLEADDKDNASDEDDDEDSSSELAMRLTILRRAVLPDLFPFLWLLLPFVIFVIYFLGSTGQIASDATTTIVGGNPSGNAGAPYVPLGSVSEKSLINQSFVLMTFWATCNVGLWILFMLLRVLILVVVMNLLPYESQQLTAFFRPVDPALFYVAWSATACALWVAVYSPSDIYVVPYAGSTERTPLYFCLFFGKKLLMTEKMMRNSKLLWTITIILTSRQLLLSVLTFLFELGFLKSVNGPLITYLRKYAILRRLNTRWAASSDAREAEAVTDDVQAEDGDTVQKDRESKAAPGSTVVGLVRQSSRTQYEDELSKSSNLRVFRFRKTFSKTGHNREFKGEGMPRQLTNASIEKSMTHGLHNWYLIHYVLQFPPAFFVRGQRIELLDKASTRYVADSLFSSFVKINESLKAQSPSNDERQYDATPALDKRNKQPHMATIPEPTERMPERGLSDEFKKTAAQRAAGLGALRQLPVSVRSSRPSRSEAQAHSGQDYGADPHPGQNSSHTAAAGTSEHDKVDKVPQDAENIRIVLDSPPVAPEPSRDTHDPQQGMHFREEEPHQRASSLGADDDVREEGADAHHNPRLFSRAMSALEEHSNMLKLPFDSLKPSILKSPPSSPPFSRCSSLRSDVSETELELPQQVIRDDPYPGAPNLNESLFSNKSLYGSKILQEWNAAPPVQRKEAAVLDKSFFERYLKSEEADEFMNQVDLGGYGQINKRMMKRAMFSAYKLRGSFVKGVKNQASICKTVEKMISLLLWAVAVLVLLLVLGLNFNTVIVSGAATLSALTVALSHIYAEFVGAVIFIAVTNPYNVGDRVFVDGGTPLYVKRIRTYTTEFEDIYGKRLIYSNNVLWKSTIINEARAKNASLNFEIRLDIRTQMVHLRLLEKGIKKAMDCQRMDYVRDSFAIFITSVQPGRWIDVSIWLTTVEGWGNIVKVIRLRTDILLVVQRLCTQLGITYVEPILPVQLTK